MFLFLYSENANFLSISSKICSLLQRRQHLFTKQKLCLLNLIDMKVADFAPLLMLFIADDLKYIKK